MGAGQTSPTSAITISRQCNCMRMPSEVAGRHVPEERGNTGSDRRPFFAGPTKTNAIPPGVANLAHPQSGFDLHRSATDLRAKTGKVSHRLLQIRHMPIDKGATARLEPGKACSYQPSACSTLET